MPAVTRCTFQRESERERQMWVVVKLIRNKAAAAMFAFVPCTGLCYWCIWPGNQTAAPFSDAAAKWYLYQLQPGGCLRTHTLKCTFTTGYSENKHNSSRHNNGFDVGTETGSRCKHSEPIVFLEFVWNMFAFGLSSCTIIITATWIHVFASMLGTMHSKINHTAK